MRDVYIDMAMMVMVPYCIMFIYACMYMSARILYSVLLLLLLLVLLLLLKIGFQTSYTPSSSTAYTYLFVVILTYLALEMNNRIFEYML